jgi:anthranilate phosphoribosyltransferase
VRRELAVPTVMNVIGPLANPALAGRQVIGVADPERLPVIAGALASLGTVHSLVVHGEPGLDEISPLGPTRIIEVRNGALAEWAVTPEELGCATTHPSELAGGSPAENAALVEACLSGDAPDGAIAAVLLNAGAAIYVAGLASSLRDGVDAARAAIADGSASAALGRLRAALPRG